MLNTQNTEVTTSEKKVVEGEKKNVYKAVSLFLIILSVFFVLKIVHGFKGNNILGMGAETHIISVSGHGEVQAVPDLANVYFSVTKDATTAKEAQDAVAKIGNDAIKSLKDNKVLEKDIKTESVNLYPKQEWQSAGGVRLPCNQWGCPPGSGNYVIVGYQASESISVKVRDPDNSGKIIQDLGALGVTDLSGPTFSIDDEEALKADARKEAIDNAKEKAQALARDLGVKLGHITSFNENGGYVPPMVYGSAMLKATDAGTSTVAELPKGENTISSDVTITYEIR